MDKKTNDDMDIISDSAGESEIRKYFAGKTVLITGSTGFMGMCLVEKLLRGCPDLKKMYILVRPKRELTPEDRKNKFLDNMLFNTLREKHPEYLSKIQLVGGDLMQDNMALTEKDKNALIDEVNIMFHNASNVKFTEKIGTMLKINVLGTKSMLDLAKQCKHIEGFLYVSTAYSHAYNDVILEEAYPSPADMKMVQDMIAADAASSSGLSDTVVSDILGKFPNFYSYTKAIAEGLVNDAGKQVSFPCIVYRPTIVLSTWKEPYGGWNANLNGPAMLFIGWGLGVIHAVYKGDSRLDFIPVDMVINSMLVVMWHAVKYRSHEKPLIYNYGSSNYKPLSLRRFETLVPVTHDGILDCASMHQLWHPSLIYTDNLFIFAILFVLLHVIPAIFADLYLLFKGKKPRALSICKKAAVSWKVLAYFIRGNFAINTSETMKAINSMSPVDRQLFFCDVRELDWIEFGKTYSMGLRQWSIHDPISTLPEAKRRARILKKIHYATKYTFLLLIVYLIATKLGLL